MARLVVGVYEYQYNALNHLDKSLSTRQKTNAIVPDVIYIYTSNGELGIQKDLVIGAAIGL